MVKILAIGDFHGKFPSKVKKFINEEKPDLIVSTGDYFPFSYRKIWFKHCYRTDKELWEVIGKKKMKEYINKDLKKGERSIKTLNSLKYPIISVTGNLDYTKHQDAIDYKTQKWKWPSQDFFSNIIKKYKNIKIIDYSYFKFKGIVFIGMATSTFPGRVKSKNYKRLRKKLDKLFKKFKHEKIIFVSHNVPYKSRFSKVNSKDAPKDVQGTQKGSKLIARIIKQYKPVLNITGHMHEYQGKTKFADSLIIAVGSAHEGKCAIIDYDETKNKVKSVKFFK